MIRYCFVVTKGGYFPHMIRKETGRPGSYEWHKAFNAYPGCVGEIKHVQDIANTDFSHYDIIHVNLAGVTTETIRTIKELIKGSSTKLLVNLDYCIEKFEEPWQRDARLFLKALKSADFLFAQEPFQQKVLQMFWKHVVQRKEKIPLISHPVDTEGLKRLYVKPEDRMDMVACMYRRYQPHIIIPSIIARGGKMRTRGQLKDISVEVPTILYGVTAKLVDLTLFDYTAVRKNWDKYIYSLSHCTVALSYCTFHSMDRFLAECATLGIPAVATTNSYFGKQLFPRTTFSPLHLERMIKAVRKLKQDEKFWNYVKDVAWDSVEKFNYRNSVEHLLEGMRGWKIKI